MNSENKQIFQRLKGGLIVSCQAEGDDPFNSPDGVILFARAAEMGGAIGIRSEGIEKTKSIIQSVELPVIGLLKREFPDGSVCITRTMEDIRNLHHIGCDIVAVDGTKREYEGITGSELIQMVKTDFPDLAIMADIDTLESANDSVAAGADCLSTTLNGYTPDTENTDTSVPDLKLVEQLASNFDIPVFAEGRYNTPELARKAIQCGAWAVVVGTAITRPRAITGWFADALKER